MPAISTVAGTHGYGRAGKTQDVLSTIPYIEVADPNVDATQWVVKYTTDGNILWRALISGGGGVTYTTDGNAMMSGNSAADSAGNIYVVGQFQRASVTFYSSDGTLFQSFALTGTLGISDPFLVKYNSNGIVQWIARVVTSSGSDTLPSIATDTSGNIFVGGSFSGTVTFMDASGIPYRQFTSTSTTDGFVAKLDTFGAFQWISFLVGSAASDRVGGLATDSAGNVYAGVNHAGTLITYNGATSSSNLVVFGATLANISNASNVLIKYNASGVIQWRSRFAGNGGGGSLSNVVINSASTNLYISFSYNGSVFFYDAANTLVFTGAAASGNNNESALANYDSNGTPVWFARNSSSTGDAANNVVIDAADNVYLLTNQGNVTTIFNGGSGPSFAGATDSPSFATAVPLGQLVTKYNSAGQIQWYGRFTNTIPTGFFCDAIGNLYISLFNTAQFVYIGPATSTTGPPFYGGTNDMHVVKLNTNGLFQWSTRIVSSTQSEVSMSTRTDSRGNLIVVGTTAAIPYPNSTLLYSSDGTLFAELPPALHNTTDTFVARYTTLGVGSWAANIGSFNGTTASRFVTASNSGDVYVVGQYSGVPLRAFGGTGGTSRTINTVGTAPDHFLVKYNSIGQTQWMVRMTTTATTEVVSNLKTDSSGNVYVAVYFTSSITFTGTDGTSNTISPANPHIVLIKYNSAGVIQWFARMTNSFASGTTYRVCLGVDAGDNVLVAGLYEGTGFVFGQSDTSSFATTLTNSGSPEGFLVKYTSAGFVTWVTKYQGTNIEFGTQIDMDANNNIYIAGFIGTVTMSFFNASAPNGAAVATLAPQSGPDTFVVKYNASGTYQWAYRFGGSGPETATGIAADNAGNSYLIATYTLAATTFPSPSFTIPAPTGTDIVIIKYDTSGVPQWFTRITGAGTEAAGNIACNKTTGDIYFVGQMGTSGVTIVDASGNSTAALVPESSNNDGFLVAMNTNGSLLWAVRTAGIAAESITGVDVNTSSNSLVITGTYALNGTWACSVGY